MGYIGLYQSMTTSIQRENIPAMCFFWMDEHKYMPLDEISHRKKKIQNSQIPKDKNGEHMYKMM